MLWSIVSSFRFKTDADDNLPKNARTRALNELPSGGGWHQTAKDLGIERDDGISSKTDEVATICTIDLYYKLCTRNEIQISSAGGDGADINQPEMAWHLGAEG